ncbi:Senescence_reg domain-containing protein [Cephalotus follicularis]|uniref:Senescence_reg domain-containing protein n=1 Tax=Cephalotus follicularis TaxID=3775 RepID=A0A1Q3BEZ1_CEPFO|nr:Senescence_reg domain-containing protein [Cephalotus follicularis]
MATSKSYYSRPNYRFLSSDHHLTNDSSQIELDESDFFGNSVSTRSNSPEFRKPISATSRKKPTATKRPDSSVGGNPSSLPVNIPDWSKILRDEYRDNRRRESEDDDDVDGEDCFEGGERVPPHEFLARQMARTRITPFSVHEGIGRTLKGRDLSRVRNAIWEKTGFQD